MFEIYFLFLSIIFVNDIEKSVYFLLINDDKTLTRRKIIKIVYKINLNKILKVNEIINKALQQFAQIIIKQIHFFFNKYIKENIQSLHFKKVFIIILQKLNKKNYTKLSLYKLIVLLNTLNKLLKLIISKRF